MAPPVPYQLCLEGEQDQSQSYCLGLFLQDSAVKADKDTSGTLLFSQFQERLLNPSTGFFPLLEIGQLQTLS